MPKRGTIAGMPFTENEDGVPVTKTKAHGTRTAKEVADDRQNAAEYAALLAENIGGDAELERYADRAAKNARELRKYVK